MAFIGMRHVVAAVFSAEGAAGAAPSYQSAGFDVGKAITGNLTINRNSNPLYADDVVAEDDTGITGIELELGLDDLDEDTKDKMGLIKKVSAGSPAVTTYYDTELSSVPVGLGYIRVRRKGGTTTYQAVWYYKMTFSNTSETSQTKGEQIEWQTPTITGRGAGIYLAATEAITFRAVQNFDTEAAAATYLDGLAGITRT